MRMCENKGGKKRETTTTNAVLYTIHLTIKYQYSQMIMTKLIKCTNI